MKSINSQFLQSTFSLFGTNPSESQESVKFFPEVLNSRENSLPSPVHIIEMIFSLIFLIKSCLENPIMEKKLIFLSIYFSFCLIILILDRIYNDNKSKLNIQSFYAIKQISFVLTAYLLLKDIVSKDQIFFLGFYLLYMFYNSNLCLNNNLLCYISFSFTILCFSFNDITNPDNIILLLMNFSFCLIQPYLILLRSHEYRLFHNFNLLPGYVFNNIYPGANIILRKQKRVNINSPSLKLEYKNFQAHNDYEINTYVELLQFFKDLVEIQKYQIASKHGSLKSEKISVSESKIWNFSEGGNLLVDLFKALSENDFFQVTEPFLFTGFSKKRQHYLRIYISFFIYNNERFYFINIDKNQISQEIKSLKEVSLRKDKILASVSHDLRSPLSGIITFVNYAKIIEDINERNKYLDYSRINADLLMSMINDLLDYSAINKGNINLSISDVSLNQIIKEVYELMKIQADIKNLHFKILNNFQNNDLPMQTDSRRIKQILINLLNNAIKFTIKGCIQLNVLKTDNKEIIKFEVIDTGIGIKQDIINSLGKEYATFDTENGLNKYGIGLGLNICKKLIKLLGPNEDLFISSVYGKGTKIGFLLYDRIQDQSTLSIKTILTFSPRKKKFFLEKLKSSGNCLELPKEFELDRARSQNNKDFQIQLHDTNNNFYNSICHGTANNITSNYNNSIIMSTPNNNNNPLFVIGNGIGNVSKRESMSEFNNKMETRRSLLKGESLHQNNLEYIENRNHYQKQVFFNSDSMGPKEDPGVIFSPYESLSMESEESNFFKEGDIKINLKFFEDDETFECDPKEKKTDTWIKLMIVDDNPFNLLILQSYFKKFTCYNFIIETAGNGFDSLQKFVENNGIHSHNPFKFIFMDCIMPIKDGYQASKEIKDFISKEEFYDVIIIAVTGMTGVEEEKKCIMSGMDDFLTKPVQEQDLCDILKFYINKFEIN